MTMLPHSVPTSPTLSAASTASLPLAASIPSAQQAKEGITKGLSTDDLLLPRGVGGVFDLAFDLYRAHFRTFFTIVAVTLLPTLTILHLLLNFWLTPLNTYVDAHADDLSASLGLIVGGSLTGYPPAGIPGLLSLLALAFLSAPLAIACADCYRGHIPQWADCYRRAWPRIPRVLMGWLVVLCVFVAVLALSFVLDSILFTAFALAFGRALPGFAAALLIIAFLLTPYVLGMTVFAFGFIFTTPLIVLEDTPITAIPVRTWQLVKKPRARRTWTTVVFLPVVFLIVQTLMLISTSELLALVSLPRPILFCLDTGLSALLIAFLQPYLLILLNILYFDYRIQRDGLDISLLAASLPPLYLPGSYAPPSVFAPSPPAYPPPLTSPFPQSTAPGMHPAAASAIYPDRGGVAPAVPQTPSPAAAAFDWSPAPQSAPVSGPASETIPAPETPAPLMPSVSVSPSLPPMDFTSFLPTETTKENVE